MLKVQVELKGFLGRYAGPDRPDGIIEVELPQGAVIRDALEKICVPEASAGLILLNGQRSRLTDCLTSNDTIIIFPVVAGG